MKPLIILSEVIYVEDDLITMFITQLTVASHLRFWNFSSSQNNLFEHPVHSFDRISDLSVNLTSSVQDNSQDDGWTMIGSSQLSNQLILEVSICSVILRCFFH